MIYSMQILKFNILSLVAQAASVFGGGTIHKSFNFLVAYFLLL